MILLAGYVKYPPGAVEQLRPAMQRVMAATRAEPGCINYDFAIDVADPDRLLIYEKWHDRAALDRHGASAHVAQWRKAGAGYPALDRNLVVWEVGEGRPL
jgi:quinol monooxygenase YgiN